MSVNGATTIDSLIVAAFAVTATPPVTLTAPSTIEDGTPSTWTGTLLDTLASTGDVFLQETAIATGSVLQTYGTPTATTIPDVSNDIGQDELRDSGTGSVLGIATTADIEASGATTAVHLLSVDNGSDPEGTFPTVISTETTIQTVQTMSGVAATGRGQGFFSIEIIPTVEDNHQCSIPKVVNGVTITLDASGDGSFTTLEAEMDAAGGLIAFDALYFTPSTLQWSKVRVVVSTLGITSIDDGTVLSDQTNVVITGEGFAGATSVRFTLDGDLLFEPQVFTVDSDIQITIPAVSLGRLPHTDGAQTIQVEVLTEENLWILANGFWFDGGIWIDSDVWID